MASGLSTLIKDHLAGGASRLTALRLPQILPVFSVDAPCHPGAALRDLVLVQPGQTTSRREFLRVVPLMASAIALPACGYSLAGRGSFLPPSIKVIGVPMFTNNTPIFEIEKRITPRVISELIGRGKYKVQPDANNVDALLTGEISSITVMPATFTPDRQASKYVITVITKIEFRDVKADKVLWSTPYLPFREDYEVSNTANINDPAAFLGQDVNALDRLAVELARSIVSAILEAF